MSVAIDHLLVALCDGSVSISALSAELRSSGCLDDASGATNSVARFSASLADLLPKGSRIDAQIDLKMKRHRRLLEGLATSGVQLPKPVMEVRTHLGSDVDEQHSKLFANMDICIAFYPFAS